MGGRRAASFPCLHLPYVHVSVLVGGGCGRAQGDDWGTCAALSQFGTVGHVWPPLPRYSPPYFDVPVALTASANTHVSPSFVNPSPLFQTVLDCAGRARCRRRIVQQQQLASSAKSIRVHHRAGTNVHKVQSVRIKILPRANGSTNSISNQN